MSLSIWKLFSWTVLIYWTDTALCSKIVAKPNYQREWQFKKSSFQRHLKSANITGSWTGISVSSTTTCKLSSNRHFTAPATKCGCTNKPWGAVHEPAACRRVWWTRGQREAVLSKGLTALYVSVQLFPTRQPMAVTKQQGSSSRLQAVILIIQTAHQAQRLL